MKLLKCVSDLTLDIEVVALLFVMFGGVNGTLNNVAKLKLTWRAGYGDGTTAVDGDRTSCMQNNTHSTPHWIVDLGTAFVIDSINLYSHQYNCSDVIATVSMDYQSYEFFDDQPDVKDDLYEFKPKNPIPGQWVKLSRNVSGDLSFCEVEVMTDKFFNRGTLNNVAKLKITWRAGYGDGTTAVDGDRTSCMQRNTHSTPHWIVDLGTAFVIDSINLYSHQYNCSDVIATVSMDYQSYEFFDDLPDVKDDLYEFKPKNPIPGQWVKLSRNVSGDLSFCEVEVMTDKFYNRDMIKMMSVDGMEGTGSVKKISRVATTLRCVSRCLSNQKCFGINVITTSSQEMECRLLGSDAHDLLMGTSSITYWKIIY